MSKIPKLMRGAEPQFYRGNEIGCLVTHGFMASPGEVGWLGQHLAEQSYTVYVPRLAGHGIDPKHMRRMRWQDWYAQMQDGYHLLRQQCEKVIVIGHSMGGLLSILLAANEQVDALVVAATPISAGEKDPKLRYSRLTDLIRPYLYFPTEPELRAKIEAEQRQRGDSIIMGRVHYHKWSTRAIYEYYAVERAARQQLSQVTTPLLLLYAEQDETATIESAETIAARVRSSKIEKHILKDGAHIIFQDSGRDEAFQVVADFVAQIISEEEV
jgi:carboxylesterase